MTILHDVSVVVSIIILLISSYGFLRKKWNMWTVFVFYWLAVSLFSFGVLPTQFPSWSLSRQVIYTILLSIGSFIVIGSMLKYILVKKGK